MLYKGKITPNFRKNREKERTAKFPTAHPFLWLALDLPVAPFLDWPVLGRMSESQAEDANERFYRSCLYFVADSLHLEASASCLILFCNQENCCRELALGRHLAIL